jgi:hypothetical protein
MRSFRLAIGTWTALLVAGFAVVFLLGQPVRTADEDLAAAMHPATPVTQQAAESTADTIVRIQYPAFSGVARTVALAKDFNIEHWVVEYTDRSGSAPRGLRISIVVKTGRVEVNSYP